MTAGLVIGVGARRGVGAGELLRLIRTVLAEHGLSALPVGQLATVEGKSGEPGLVEAARELGVPLLAHSPAELAAVPVPHPSAAVLSAVGTPSVCEAAALLGSDGGLLVPKRGPSPRDGPAMCTIAVARLRVPAARHTTHAPPEQGDHVNLPALLLVGDGYYGEEEAEAVRTLVARLSEQHPEMAIAGGSTGPAGVAALTDAVDGLATGGARELVTVALSLTPGAAERAEEKARHDDLTPIPAAPMSGHPAVLTALGRRVEAALRPAAGEHRSPGDRAATFVLLVGPGSIRTTANAEICRVARLLWEGRGLSGVEAAFVSMAAPDVPAGLDRCRLLGARRVVVLPYALLPGELDQRARLQAEGWSEAHPDIDVRQADVISLDELADLVMECREEAVAGGTGRDGHASAGTARRGR